MFSSSSLAIMNLRPGYENGNRRGAALTAWSTGRAG
jgi:hypothetical protein